MRDMLVVSSLIRTLPSAQESHLFGAVARQLRSRALPPVWNFTNPQRFIFEISTEKKLLGAENCAIIF